MASVHPNYNLLGFSAALAPKFHPLMDCHGSLIFFPNTSDVASIPPIHETLLRVTRAHIWATRGGKATHIVFASCVSGVTPGSPQAPQDDLEMHRKALERIQASPGTSRRLHRLIFSPNKRKPLVSMAFRAPKPWAQKACAMPEARNLQV